MSQTQACNRCRWRIRRTSHGPECFLQALASASFKLWPILPQFTVQALASAFFLLCQWPVLASSSGQCVLQAMPSAFFRLWPGRPSLMLWPVFPSCSVLWPVLPSRLQALASQCFLTEALAGQCFFQALLATVPSHPSALRVRASRVNEFLSDTVPEPGESSVKAAESSGLSQVCGRPPGPDQRVVRWSLGVQPHLFISTFYSSSLHMSVTVRSNLARAE